MRNRRKQRRAIYNYNHSVIYVNTVLAVADYLEEMNRGDPKPSHSIRNGLSIGFVAESPGVAVSKVFFDDGKDFACIEATII